jgi:glucose-6-phosphate dehydrogenase assembly protein OpcA
VEEAVTSTVNPERVLKELADLWVSLGKQGQSEGGTGVLRACTMTLVVMAEDDHDWSALGETIAALMPEHPARTISVRLSGAGDRALSDRVYSQCWMPFGQRRQICCEQVEITVSDAALLDLPSVVRPLAVPDLPLILWCRSPRVLTKPEFADIADMTHKVIIDSEGMPLQAVAKLASHDTLLGDLAWTRLTRWRETLSQVFENKQNLARIGELKDLRMEHNPNQARTAAYFSAWVADILPGLAISVLPQEQCDGLRLTLSGSDFRVQLERQDEKLAVTVDGLSHFTNLPPPTDYGVMREELGIVRRDPAFERAFARAIR